MVGHGGSSASSYLADPTSPIPSHCASIVMTSTLRVNLSRILFTISCKHVLYNTLEMCTQFTIRENVCVNL